MAAEKMLPSGSTPSQSTAPRQVTPPLPHERRTPEGAILSFAAAASKAGQQRAMPSLSSGSADPNTSPSEVTSLPPTMMDCGLRRASSAGARTKARAEALTTAALYKQHVENDLTSALTLHRSALALLRSAANDEASDAAQHKQRRSETYDVEIATTLTDIGDVHRRREEPLEGMGSYREALTIFRTVCERSGREGQEQGDGGENLSGGGGGASLSANHPGVRAAERGVQLLEGRFRR